MEFQDNFRGFINSSLNLYKNDKPFKDDVRKLCFDITLTTACNSRCFYCFEKNTNYEHKFLSEDQILLFCYRMEKLLKTEYFKNNYDILQIGFWGGEPTLNYTALKFILRYFLYFDNVQFHLYTNGVNLNNVFENLIYYSKAKTKYGEPRILVQISYDGEPLHSKYRKHTESVRDSIKMCIKYGVHFTIKSVLSLTDSSNLYQVYKDIYDLQNDYNSSFKGYCPTIEYKQDLNEISRSQFSSLLQQLELNLYSIIYFELQRWEQNENVKPFISWFSPENLKRNCAAGKDLFVIDIDGFIYKCHGALYTTNKKLHVISHFELDFLNDIIKSKNNHLQYESVTSISEQCNNCETDLCFKCPIQNFDDSLHQNYFDRWYDFSNNERRCIINNIISLKRREFNSIKEKCIKGD